MRWYFGSKVPQNEALKSILSRFIHEARNYTCENLFSADGINPLGKRTVHQIVVKHLKNAGLYNSGMTSETLRKSGVYLLQKYSDFDYNEIQEYLGLKSQASLKTYSNIKDSSLVDKVNKNPLSKIKIWKIFINYSLNLRLANSLWYNKYISPSVYF